MKKWILLPLLALSFSANALVLRTYYSQVKCELDIYNDLTISVDNQPVIVWDMPSNDRRGAIAKIWCENRLEQAKDAISTNKGSGYILINPDAGNESDDAMKVEYNADVCPKN